jgi:hypothetical protein
MLSKSLCVCLLASSLPLAANCARADDAALAGRTPALDLESAFLRQLDQMKPADYAAEARRCGAEVTAKGNQLVKVEACGHYAHRPLDTIGSSM